MSTGSLKRRNYNGIFTSNFFCFPLLPSFSIRKQISFISIKKYINKIQKERAGSPGTISLHQKILYVIGNVPNPTRTPTGTTSSTVQLSLEMRGRCPGI